MEDSITLTTAPSPMKLIDRDLVVLQSACNLSSSQYVRRDSWLTLDRRRYAYNASPSREGRDVLPPNLSHAQLDPIRRSQNRYLQPPDLDNSAHIPTESDSEEIYVDHRPPHSTHPHRQPNRRIYDGAAQMPPPALPASVSGGTRQAQPLQRNSLMLPSTPRHRSTIQPIPQRPAGTDNRNTMPQSNFRAATPSLQTQRFVPSVPSTPSGRNFSASSSNAAGPSSGFVSGLPRGTRDSKFRMSSSATGSASGQRLPFVPGQRDL